MVVEYTYDAWGKILSISGSMASTLGVQNPLRYRGYVYDQETGLYYLQSRYYDPEIGRFINADVFTSTGQGLLGNNMFAYCLNNPVVFSDPSGNIPFADNPFSETFQQIGERLSPYVALFFSKFARSFAGSYSISGEFGSGFGFSGKLGKTAVDVSAIIVADEWTRNADGTTEEIRKGSIAVEGEIAEVASVGIDITYYVPLEAGKKYGLLGAPGGKFDAIVGVYMFDQGIGLNTTSRDVELAFGFSGYFILGGGFEFSINLSKFVNIWCSN